MSKGVTFNAGYIMLDDYGFETYENNDFPIAYLLTFRTYGTWHHGDKRYSVGRNGKNGYGSPMFRPSVPFVESMRDLQAEPSFILNEEQRHLVAETIATVCAFRNYVLRGSNVRSNHAHVVASGCVKPEKIVNDFKTYATRRLREEYSDLVDRRIWSRGASTRYLWKPKHVLAAVDYVLYCQEDVPFEFKD